MDRLLVIEKGRKEARTRLEALSHALSAVAFLRRDPEDPGLAVVLHHVDKLILDNLIFRIGEGFGAPVITVLTGGTGVGKSTLLNTIAGRKISDISVKRPCTTAPLVYHHEDHGETLQGDSFLPGYSKGEGAGTEEKEVILVSHDDESLREVILVDSPDFDSVSDRNRDLSEDILRIADLVIYVVNPEKYADDEVWKVIRKIASGGRPVEFLFNRAQDESDEAYQHFEELLEEAEIQAGVDLIFEWRGVSGKGFISDPGSARRIREILAGLVVGGEEGKVRGAALNETWDEVRSSLEKKIIPALRSDADLVRSLQGRMEREWREAERRILEEVNLEHAADRQRASEILRSNLFDLVQFFEKKIFGPIGMWIERWSGALGRRIGRTKEGMRASLESCHEGNRAAIRRHLREGAERVRALLEGDPRGKAILRSEEWRGVLLGEGKIDELYDSKRKSYAAWLRGEFDGLVAHVKTTRSFQLGLLQVLYLVLMIGGMAHTGGAITVAEGLLAGPILMLLDRLFVRAIDWEVVEKLQKSAQEKFREIFPEIVAEQIGGGTGFCEALAEGAAPASEIAGLLNEIDAHLSPVVEALAAEEER